MIEAYAVWAKQEITRLEEEKAELVEALSFLNSALLDDYGAEYPHIVEMLSKHIGGEVKDDGKRSSRNS